MSYKETFQVNSVSIPCVFDATLSAIDEIGWRVTGGNSIGTLVIAKTGFSFKSSGETVYIAFREVASGVEVEVRSTCKWQLSSWGKNAENVARVHLSIERHLEPVPEQITIRSDIRDETCEERGARVRSSKKYCYNCGTALESTISPEVRGLATQKMKHCACGESVSAVAKFCPFCGISTTAINYCRSCGYRFAAGQNFCSQCGAKRNGKLETPP